GFRQAAASGEPHHASDPTTGQSLEPGFFPPTAEEIELAVQLAAQAFPVYRHTSGRERAAFLRKIAENIEAVAPEIMERAGGDTASALASGNPVIVKAHGAHPGTSELVGRALQDAVRQCGLPEGVFSLLFGSGSQVGTTLMKHPLVKAGGFTGSRIAGRILMDVAASRPEPIPFYAEMSSTNPVFILPGALRERADA